MNDQLLLAVLFTQSLGIIALGLIKDALGVACQANLKRGLKMLSGCCGIATLALLGGGGGPVLVALYRSQAWYANGEVIIWIFLFVDIGIIFFLVCQQGGLSRSVLIQVFFLIPVAHLAVEQNMYLVWCVFAVVVVCIVISNWVGRLVTAEVKKSTGVLPRFRLIGEITDFQTLAPAEYDIALWRMSVISMLIVAVQVIIKYFIVA